MSRDVRVLVWLPDRPARPDIAAIPAANREWLLPRSMVSEPQRGASRKNVEGNSEHTAADRALRESEARFRTLVESANDAIFIWDRDLRCLEANRAACERLGYSHAELLTMTAADVSAPEQAASAAARAVAIVEQGSALVESVHMARDGTRIPVEVSTTVTSLGGRPVFLSIARDVTKRKRAEQQLRFLGQAIQSQTSGFVLTDLQGNLTQVNPAFLRLWGYGAPDEVLGRSALEFVQRPEEVAESLRIVGSAGAWTGEIEAKRRDSSSFPVQIAASLVKGDDGQPLYTTALFEDNTERRLAAQLVAAARDSLEEAQRVAHLGSWKFDPVADEISGSAEFFRLFDAAPEEIVHYQQFVERLHRDDRERVNRDVAAALEENQPYDTEYRVRLGDGGWRDIHARGQVVTDVDGKSLRFVGTCLDITKHKRAADRIRDTQVLLNQPQAIAQIGGWMYDVASDQVHLDRRGLPNPRAVPRRVRTQQRSAGHRVLRAR